MKNIFFQEFKTKKLTAINFTNVNYIEFEEKTNNNQVIITVRYNYNQLVIHHNFDEIKTILTGHKFVFLHNAETKKEIAVNLENINYIIDIPDNISTINCIIRLYFDNEFVDITCSCNELNTILGQKNK